MIGSTEAMALPRTWHLFGEDHLPYQILLLAKIIDRESARHLQSQHGRSLAEWRVLAFICGIGPSSASEIGTAAEIDRAEISRAVTKLSAAGLIERNPADGNRRRLVIRPTPAGKAEYRKIRGERRAYFQAIMSGVPAKQRPEFGRHLEAIAERVDSVR